MLAKLPMAKLLLICLIYIVAASSVYSRPLRDSSYETNELAATSNAGTSTNVVEVESEQPQEDSLPGENMTAGDDESFEVIGPCSEESFDDESSTQALDCRRILAGDYAPPRMATNPKVGN